MSEHAVAEYAEAVRRRYALAGRVDKGRILDEFCATTGMHRKAAIRLLNRRAVPAAERRGRPRRYGAEFAAALVDLWQVSDRMCGKLLAAVMPDLVDALERHDERHFAPELRGQLLAVSPATIDRVIGHQRKRLGVQPRRRSPSGGLKAEIPVRTWRDWGATPVGSLQADLVLHCGESTEGFYLATLCAVDVATGWTELQPVWGLGKQRVGTAIHLIRQRLPFGLRSLHTDNGSEFINHTLYNWCRNEGIQVSRGRSYRKNDQAYVEQRNWLTVRRTVGYDRLASKRAFALLEQLYPLVSQQLNYFRPVRKLVAKDRVEARVRKSYDEPRTSYQRLLESGQISSAQALDLQGAKLDINPAELQRRINRLLRELWQLGRQDAMLTEDAG